MSRRAKAAGAAGLALDLIATSAAALGAPVPVWIVVGSLGLLLLAYAVVQWLGPDEEAPVSGQAATASETGPGSVSGNVIQHSNVVTGRNVRVIPAPSGPTRADRFRSVETEVRHIKRRFDQLERNRAEWQSIWPGKHAPYRILPAEKWNLYGEKLGLSEADHEVVQEAYEQANDFNYEMLSGPSAFGDPEPDLEGLRAAFDRAEAVLSAAKGGSR